LFKNRNILILLLFWIFIYINDSSSDPFITNGDFEDNGGLFQTALGWSTFGEVNKTEGVFEQNHNWVQGLSDFTPQASVGIYQIVSGTIIGNIYRLIVEGKTADKTSQTAPPDGNQMLIAIGVNPSGGIIPAESTWGDETYGNFWQTLSCEFEAEEESATVFLRTRSIHQQQAIWSWIYFDNVQIELIATPTPKSTDTPTMTNYLLGDVNCDRHITPGDALLAFEIYLETYIPTGQELCDQMKAADYNENGLVSPGDALCIFFSYLQQSC